MKIRKKRFGFNFNINEEIETNVNAPKHIKAFSDKNMTDEEKLQLYERYVKELSSDYLKR